MVKASLDLTGLVPNLPQVQKPNFPSPKLSSGTQKPYQITAANGTNRYNKLFFEIPNWK